MVIWFKNKGTGIGTLTVNCVRSIPVRKVTFAKNKTIQSATRIIERDELKDLCKTNIVFDWLYLGLLT